MDVRCERCRAQYVLDDDRVTPAGLTVQCTNCGHLFKLKKKELVVTVPVKPEDVEGTPLHGLAPLAVPFQGVGALPHPPPPPSGFPPPAFASPPARAARPPEPPPPELDVDVDLGLDDDPAPAGGARRWFFAAAVVAVLGAGGWLGAPLFLGHGPPRPAALAVAREPPPAPMPVPAAAPPAPEPPPAPVVAPQLVEEPPPPPPEPVKPALAPPKGPKVLLARAKALLEKGDSRAALELFGRVASRDPDNVEAQAGRGLCYLDLESWAPAEASFQAALRLQPDHADALLGLAETYRYRGQKSEAIAAYERYLARYPGGEEAEVARNALAELRE